MLWFLFSGLSLGVAAGISPGPLLALLVAQTLRHGLKEGIKVAFAPVISDAPVVVLCVLLLRSVTSIGSAVGWLSVAGACFVGYLGYDCLRTTAATGGGAPAAPRSFAKAVTINLLNPHVYLFWATVGAPMLLSGWRRTDGSAVAFAVGFYASLVGSKTAVAAAVNRSRDALAGAGYAWAMRAMGVLLLAVAVWMLSSGLAALA